jgi:molybdate transport system substrate-binding protein
MTGAAGRGWIVLGISAAAAAALVGMLSTKPAGEGARDAPRSLLLYCAAGIRAPVEAAARQYQEQYGVSIEMQFAGSGTLLSNIRVSRTGDLYLAGDESYIALAREHGLLAEVIPLARQRPVIAVPRGNPKKIRSIADLAREDVRLSLANPTAASIGQLTQRLLEQSGDWPTIKARVEQSGVFKPTVNDVANDIKLGVVDAGVVWDATATQYPELEMVRVPLFEQAQEQIMIGVLRYARDPTAALRFARYLGAPEKGLRAFEQFGYEVVDGDAWAERPEIKLFSGAMLRPAIEQTLEEFQRREGAQIITVYNGCGILTAQMRAGDRPDAYFSCDTTFMEAVADLYLNPLDIVSNDMIIMVHKGNPHAIGSVSDLARPGLRVGLAHPEKSAMGAQAKRLLEAMGVYEAVRKNVQLDSPTGDFLVNQIRTGSLDAVLVCRSNAAFVREHLDLIAIQHPLARMTQPYAVGKHSRHKLLMQRLLDAIAAAESRQRFESVGFDWRAPARSN